jgi:hypothetical protein
VSELYAAVLMVGVTLSLGSLVVAAATSQFGLATDSASLGASLREGAAGTQLGMVYAAVQPSGSCPAYEGGQEGSTLTIAVFDYGSAGFTPAGFVVNSTVYAGSFGEAAPGALAQYTVALASCAHQSGLTVLAYDSSGEEVQFGT